MLRNLTTVCSLPSGFSSKVSVVSNDAGEEYVLKRAKCIKTEDNTEPKEISINRLLWKNNVEGINKMITYGFKEQKKTHSDLSEYWILFEKKEMDLYQFCCDCDIGETLACLITEKLVKILIDMHEKVKMIHMDLKLENILVDRPTGVIELCDFGQCVPSDLDSLAVEYIGTYLYNAPELFEDRCYPTKSIVWSLGMVVYLMLHSNEPWKRYTGQANVKDMYFDPKYSLEYREFVMCCLQPDVEKRIDLLNVMSLDWLAKKIREI